MKRLRNNEKASVKTSNTWLCSPICNCLICEKPKIISVRKEKKMLNDAFENYETWLRFCVSIKKKEYRDLGPLWIVTLDSEKIDNDFVKSLKKNVLFCHKTCFLLQVSEKKLIIFALRAKLLKRQSSCHTNYTINMLSLILFSICSFNMCWFFLSYDWSVNAVWGRIQWNNSWKSGIFDN